MAGVRIAVTGTPGSGKTTFCSAIEYPSMTVEEIAVNHGCIGEVEDDGAAPIDLDKLCSIVAWPEGDMLLLDGHLSHLLPIDAIVLIRCHPSDLRKRLSQRDYADSKIEENVECELIGSVAAECLNKPCLELDSAIGIQAMIDCAERWITDGFKPLRPNEPIDWIGQIHGDD